MIKKRKRIAVIGAGPMGLVLAMHLSERHAVVLYEQDDRLGGMSASVDFDGFVIERYYHYVNGPDRHTFDLLRKVGMHDALRWAPTNMGFFHSNAAGSGELLPWGNAAALLSFRGASLLTRIRYGLHAFACKFYGDLTPLDGISAADWIQKWEGTDGYDVFWRFLFEKKFFRLADPLSAAWIASRIRRMANSRGIFERERLGYIEGGTQALLDRLAAMIGERGGEIRLSEAVVAVRPNDAAGGGVVESSMGGESYDAVVSTVPLPYVGRIIHGLPEAYSNRLDKMTNIGCACVLFRLDKPVSDNFWLNVDMPGWDVPGIIEYSNLRPTRSKYVYVPFYAPHDHPNWKMDDATLIDKARHCIADINPVAAATERAARIFRYEFAQPVCPPGFGSMLPPYETGIRNVLAADTAHSFPEDRSINESARIAGELAVRLAATL